MMTPSAVNQETARMRTRQQIREAQAYRASKADSADRRRVPWTAIVATFRTRRTTTGTETARPLASTAN